MLSKIGGYHKDLDQNNNNNNPIRTSGGKNLRFDHLTGLFWTPPPHTRSCHNNNHNTDGATINLFCSSDFSALNTGSPFSLPA
jgi:hypothetical protein